MSAVGDAPRWQPDLASVREQVARFAWLPPARPRAGSPGERLARGTGSSLEFADRREYVAGDDVRHLDWGAYARTDQWLVRVYAREVSPRVDVLLDLSASMSVGLGGAEGPEVRAPKAALALDLAAFTLEAARAVGLSPQLIALGDQPRRVASEELQAHGLAFDARRGLPELLAECGSLMRTGSQRLLLSDLLVEQPPDRWLRILAQGSGRLDVAQVLLQGERKPEVGGAYRLTDAESGDSRDLVLDSSVVERYLDRLRSLIGGQRDAARRLGAGFLELTAEEDLAKCISEGLLRGELVAPAAIS